MSWRPVTVSNTDADTDGIKYIDVPTRREYRIYGLNVDYALSSDISYTANPTPLVDIVTTSDIHGVEETLIRFSPLVAVSDTDGYTAHYHNAPPAGSDGGPLVLAGEYFVEIPADIAISTMHRIKFWTTPSTGGAFIQDVHGLFGIRDNYGRRA